MSKIKLDTTENLLSLMTIYRTEWQYRDTCFASLFWRFLFLSLAITFFPNLVKSIGFENNSLITLPIEVYSIAGILCATFGIYLMFCDSKKIEIIDEAYKRLMQELPPEYQLKNMKKEKKFRLFSFRTNSILRATYVIVIILAIVNIIIN